MESTAQYWRPVWVALEGQCRLHLAQARSNRGPRGRKTDFRDAKRIVSRLLSAWYRFTPQPARFSPITRNAGTATLARAPKAIGATGTLQREDVSLGAGAHVHCRGKGRKERCTPLAKPTVAVLRAKKVWN